VVYDLGGGTFDASLVRMSGAHHAVLATAGLARLGGDDFDAVLAQAALSEVGLELSSLPPRAAQGLLAQCRDAKERLNPNSRKLTLDLEALLGADAPQAELTVKVADFYDACAPLVERTIEAMAPVLSRARVDEEEAPPDLADIAGLYVVGGASLLPVIARTLRERFGRRVHRSPYPSAAVAIGLAIAADESAGFALSDRYGRTFGVFREAADGQEITFDPIFTRDTELPGGSGPLTRTRTYRAAHNVGHFRFFESTAVEEDGKPRGDMALFGDVFFPFDPRLAETGDLARIAVERKSEGPRIVERYSLHDSGIVDVLIRNVDTGYERAFRLGA
jgi:molecular chaperone DnaK (HSP70)